METDIKMNSRERRVLINCCFGHFMSHFNMLAFPAVVIPLSSQLGMNMAEVLEISFFMYLLFGITALPWGLAGDKWGSRPFFALFYAGCGLSGLVSAIWMERPEYLIFSLASMGLFSGIYHPIGLGMISREIKRVSIGMGYNGIFGNLGLAVAPFTAGLINWIWGLKAVYFFIGSMNLLGIVLMMVLNRTDSEERTPKSEGLNTQADNGLMSAFLVLLVVMMLGGIEYRGATVIMPAYFELKTQHIFSSISGYIGRNISGNVFATTVTSFIFLVGVIGQYIGGRIGDRFEPKISYLVFHLVTVPAALLISFTTDISLVLVTTVYFFFLLGMQPIENTLVAKFTPYRFRHSAYGTKFVLTFGVGALAVKLVGAIEMHAGIESIFLAIAFIASMLVIGIGILMYTVRRISSSKSYETT
jgi:MFS family permease